MAYNPSHILLAVQSLHPGLQVPVDFELADLQDGNGPFISVWNRDDLAEPTKAEIETIDTDALAKAQATFLARDLLAQLTPADYAAIVGAIGTSPALGLLWVSLLAQGETPISVSSDRFRQGWDGLIAALGADRSRIVAAAIGILE